MDVDGPRDARPEPGSAAQTGTKTSGARLPRALLVHDRPEQAAATLTALERAGTPLRALRVDTLPALDAALRGRDWDLVMLLRPLERVSDDAVLERLLQAGSATPVLVLADGLDDAAVLQLSAHGVQEVVEARDDAGISTAVDRLVGGTRSEEEHLADPGLALAIRVQHSLLGTPDLEPALERTLELVCGALRQPYAETWLRRPDGDGFLLGPGFEAEPRLAALRSAARGSNTTAVGVIREAVTSRRARVVKDLRRDGGHRFGRARAALDLGLDGVTVVPVVIADQVEAVMLSLGRDGEGLDPRVRGVLELAAGHLATALGLGRDGKRLAQERRLLDELLDLLAEGVVACDSDGQVTLFNRSMESFHGKGPVQGVGLEGWASRYDLYLADGVTAMRDAEVPILRALQGEYLEEERFVIAAPGVRRRAARASARPLRDERGAVSAALMVVRDESQEAAASAEVAGAGERAVRAFTLLLDHLADLALRVGEAQSLERAWPAFADFAERTLGADELRVVRNLDDAGGVAGRPVYAASRPLSGGADSLAREAEVSRLALEAIATRRLALDRDSEHEALVGERPMRSAAAVPLTLGTRVLGALEVRAKRPFAFDEGAAVALTMAANLAAIALDHADLVDEERRSREVAEASARHFQRIFAANPAAVAIVSPDDHSVLDANPAMEVLTGLGREELLGRSTLELGLWGSEEEPGIDPGSGEARLHEREVVLRRRDGVRRTCLVSAEATELVVHGAGTQRALLVLAVDVTDRLEQQRQLRDLARFRESLMEFVGETLSHGFDGPFYQRLLEAAVRATPGAEAGSLLLRDPNGDSYRFVAAVGYDLEGLHEVEFLDFEVSENTPTGARPAVLQGFSRERDTPERLDALIQAGRLGEIQASLVVPIELEGRRMAVLCLDNLRQRDAFDDEAVGLAEAFASQVATLIRRRTLEHELEHMAYHDGLTGLPNRTLFRDRLQQAVARAMRTKQRGAALFVDLDNLKVTNDALGHTVGDELLRAVGERLLASVRAEDTVARIGGDEFTLVLPELEDAAAAAVVADKILNALRRPFRLQGHEVHVSASVGVTLFPDDGNDADTLIRHGDTAMYQAKAQGKDRYRFFTREMNRQLLERASLEAQLRLALRREEFRLHFQPRVALDDGRITSVEALARWHNPGRGDVPPGTFIPVAEDAGLIGAVGAHLLRLACVQGRAWSDASLPTVVAFNLSARQLQERDVVGTIRSVLSDTGLDPHLLELELTESAVMHNVEENVVKLSELRSLGVQVSIDDFGTAYSSLNYLKRLPATALKIDQTFVRDVAAEGEAGRHDSAIVRAVIALAEALELVAIAEGVETVAQLRRLRTLGCDQGQGFLFAEPDDAEKITELLREGRIALP